MDAERWYTVKDIVEMLQVHEQTVREWLREGQLRGRNFGGRTGWRIRASDLELFLNADQNEKKAAA